MNSQRTPERADLRPGSMPLLVIGAGPKALAIAAKALVLRGLGREVPEIVVVERDEVAANWRRGGGWSNGEQRLGTKPEKDLGFPYRSDDPFGDGPEIDRGMARFSWTSYLMWCGDYSDWIDRGRPQPTHHQWAGYLRWVAELVELRVVHGTAVAIGYEEGCWSLTVARPEGRSIELQGTGLVVTGPGPCRQGITVDGRRRLDGASFWELAVRGALPTGRRAMVIGAGETAGSIVREISRRTSCEVTVVSPNATLYSRGESYFENVYFSDPRGWSELAEADRRELIRRTDRAVISQDVQEDLAHLPGIDWICGRVVAAEPDGEQVRVSTVYQGVESEHPVDLIVDATGGDPTWFTGLLQPTAAMVVEQALGSPLERAAFERSIGDDLAVSGLQPKLHLPNLAALAQGPGFPNLSCLGLLSDRILAGYAGGPDTPADGAAELPGLARR